MSEKLKFPAGFLWGAATSSHQVEGGTKNQWSEWEKENARRLAEKAKTQWQDWQKEKFPEMLDPKNYISGRACDHYNRYEEDFNIAKKLGHNAHRFSIEWSRIEPEEGKFDEKEVEHYRKVIKALRERGMEPFVTLWHWTNPLWIRDKRGLKSKKIVKYFGRYTEKIVSSLKDEVKFWITINEPKIYTGHSYFKGAWPPQEKSLFSYFRVINNLINVHKKAYKIIKSINSSAQIGIAKNCVYFEGNLILAEGGGYFWNKYFLNKIKNHQDFIGLNYYHRNRIKNFKFNQNENEKISDMGWEIYPAGIYHILKDLNKYNKPIYITENGLADAGDKKKEWFIKESLKSVHKAIQEGVDVRGYIYWSLLDNFEWDKGFWPRFGLVEIDYDTLERKIRPSAWKYAEICKSNISI